MKVQAQFVTSVADAGKFPPPVAPEVAFLGRSNVGKSSVLNTRMGSRLAHASDMHLLDFLRKSERDFIVVGTKSDRLSNNRLRQGLKELQEGLGVEEILPFSAKSGSGREELWRIIRQAAAGTGAAHA